MPDASLDAALDELYGVEPNEFVASRKRLVANLRGAGHKDAAKQLQGARRPSTSAWALNQLARRHPELVEGLLDRSSELQAAQTRAMSGKPDAMRDAMRAHRTALDAATDAALAILGSRSNDAFGSEIASILRAASADDDTGRLLRTGRLIHEAEFQGFPEVAGLTLVPEPRESKPAAARKRAKEPAKHSVEADTTRTDEAREAAAAAKAEREREAQRRSNLAARDAALKQATKADADATRAQARIDKLQAALEIAHRELETARDRSRTATDDAARFAAAATYDSARTSR